MQAVIEEHHDLLVSLRADVLSIKEQQKILSERIRNVFNHCKITVDMCRIGSPGNGPYWKDCATKFFPSEVEGYITLEKQCSYKSKFMDYSETLTLFEKDEQVRCDCDVTFPGENDTKPRQVAKNIDASCILTIVRCPTTLF